MGFGLIHDKCDWCKKEVSKFSADRRVLTEYNTVFCGDECLQGFMDKFADNKFTMGGDTIRLTLEEHTKAMEEKENKEK
ncbi:MAG: hypothetical protein JXA52_02320 [Planctomycetes bacterium]|nr:hypothetical protein [Planctomycetota bacterium]